MPTITDAKAMAKALEAALRGRNIAVSHGECLDIVSRQFGLKDWNVLSARAKRDEAAARRRAEELRGWGFQAEHAGAYDHGADDDDRDPDRGTALIRLDPVAAARPYPNLARAFGTYLQTVSAVPFRARRLEIRARLRCEGVTHGATIWARVDGMPGHTFAFDNLKGARSGWLFGEAPWTARSIVIDVPGDAITLHFGFFLKGSGSLWAADFSIGDADASAQITAPPVARTSVEPAWITPVNLGFSEVISPPTIAT